MSGKYSPVALSGAAQLEMEAQVLAYMGASVRAADQAELEAIRVKCHDLLDARLDIMGAIGMAAQGADPSVLTDLLKP